MINIKQVIKKNIGNILDEIIKNKTIQIFINDRYNREAFSQIDNRFIENLFYSYKGFEFAVNDQATSIFEVPDHYKFDDIKGDDIVLDLGSNVGTFSIFASKKAKQVYAVEPIYSDIVNTNVERNNIKNIVVFDAGLGQGNQRIKYGKINKVVKCYSLSEIISMCGGHIDFLKIDCEGGEWTIKPHELDGVRRIEGEIHNLDGLHDVNNFQKMLESIGFECSIHRFSDIIILIHATRKI